MYRSLPVDSGGSLIVPAAHVRICLEHDPDAENT
jgi:hypothetical protein